MTRSKSQFNGLGAMPYPLKMLWQQRHEVPLLPFLPRPSTTHLARVARQELD
jgi:hypothetical protein